MSHIASKQIESVRNAAKYNPDVQISPSCILWPDGERHWESVIPRLQSEMLELFQLGDYLPGMRIGPAIWLRCVIAGAIEGFTKQADIESMSTKVPARESKYSTNLSRSRSENQLAMRSRTCTRDRLNWSATKTHGSTNSPSSFARSMQRNLVLR